MGPMGYYSSGWVRYGAQLGCIRVCNCDFRWCFVRGLVGVIFGCYSYTRVFEFFLGVLFGAIVLVGRSSYYWVFFLGV